MKYIQYLGYFGVKKSTKYFINTIIYRYNRYRNWISYKKALTLLESQNFYLTLRYQAAWPGIELETSYILIWTLNAGVKRFILWATGPLHNSMKNRNPYSCVYYFVDCYWLIFLIFPPLESVHSVTSIQMSKYSHTHQVTQDLRMRIFLYLWICYRNNEIILL